MTRAMLDALVSLAMLIGSLGLLGEAIAINPPARAFPVAVLAAVAILAGMSLLRAIGSPRPDMSAPVWPAGNRARVLVFIAAMMTYALLLPLGYVPITFALLVALYFYLDRNAGRRALALRVVLAGAITLAAYYGFRTSLGVDLPTFFLL